MNDPKAVDRDKARERMRAARVQGMTLADRARYYAMKRLRETHPAEFHALYREFIDRERAAGAA